jgi:hypothetical protein
VADGVGVRVVDETSTRDHPGRRISDVTDAREPGRRVPHDDVRGPPPATSGVPLAGLCDLHEEDVFRRALVASGVGSPRTTRADMERLGFHVCVSDVEDDLVRAVGAAGFEALVESQGDLGSFRSLQSQPAWRGREPEAQLRRFLGSGSGRKLHYARLLVEAAVDRDTVPRPLDALLAGI